MVKQVVSIKLEQKEIADLKETAKKQGKTMTDLLTKSVYAHQKTLKLESELAEIKQSKQELEAKYERVTGKKPQYKKRISIPVSNQEYSVIRNTAFKHNTTMSQLLRNVLCKRQELPALDIMTSAR